LFGFLGLEGRTAPVFAAVIRNLYFANYR